MSPDERKERAKNLCQELSRRIADVAAPGLGRWAPAWEIVEEVSGRFLDALNEFERTGNEDARHAARVLAGDVLDAWVEADRLYRTMADREEGVPA